MGHPLERQYQRYHNYFASVYIKWRTAYAELAGICGLSHISTSDQCLLFPRAVSNLTNYQCHTSASSSDAELSESVLIWAFSDFVISENRRFANQPSYPYDAAVYDLRATYDKPANAPNQTKRFCTYHQSKTVNNQEQCQLSQHNQHNPTRDTIFLLAASQQLTFTNAYILWGTAQLHSPMLLGLSHFIV